LNIRFNLLAAASGAVLAFCAQGALAQDNSIEEVVVTAQRFEESAQRAPIIIDAVSAEELSGVSDVRQLQTVVPGMQFANAGNVIQTYVRGVGSFNAKSQNESSVAYNIDGVYLFATTQVTPAMFDLERLEVLKGPQGTLYGRNATGGAVNLITRGAKLDGAEGFVQGEVGNYDLRRVVGAYNMPLSDTFAVRIAAQHVEHEGYLSDGTNDADQTAARLRALWQPNEDVSVRFSLDGARMRGVGAGSVIYPTPAIAGGDKWVGALDPRINVGATAVGATPPFPAPRNHHDQWSVGGQLDWNLGFANLTVLPSYRHEKFNDQSYVPGYGVAENSTIRQTSLEARLANQTDKLRWVLGAYALDVDQDQIFLIRNQARGQRNDLTNPTGVKSWAIFGEATYSLTEALRLIVGLRYTEEESRSRGFQNSTINTGANLAYRPGIEVADFPINETVKAEATTWKIGAQYDLTPSSNIFATVSRGFKGGGSYVDTPASRPTFRPEYITAYEFGSRNRFFGNTLQVNGELFYWKVKDQQVAFVGFNSLNLVNFRTVNAADSTIYGADIDIVWQPTSNDRLTFGAEYLHAEHDEFIRRSPTAPIGTTCKVTGQLIDCSGKRMMRSPEWAGSASYEHTFELGNGGNIVAGADLTFATERWTSIDYSAVTIDEDYVIYNAELTYNAPDERWSASLWGRNLGEEDVLTGGLQSGTFNRPSINEPRTYGVRVQANF
jgi:iron complex outermembrane recepter protein